MHEIASSLQLAGAHYCARELTLHQSFWQDHNGAHCEKTCLEQNQWTTPVRRHQRKLKHGVDHHEEAVAEQ